MIAAVHVRRFPFFPSLRLLLVWSLLLAACVQAGAGARLAGACALHGAVAVVAADADVGSESPEDDDTHASCPCCLAQAHAFALPAQPGAMPVAMAAPAPPRPWRTWRPHRLPAADTFAARDPPARG